MKALVLHGVGDLRLESVPEPVPATGWARIKVHGCGVCGSDIPRCFEKGTYRFPTIPGHEFAGTIESFGPDTECALDVGTEVTVFPLIWCDRCEPCGRHAFAQCENYDYVGSRRDGAWAEYVVAPVRNLVPIPPKVSLGDAVLTEPSAVAVHALRRGQLSERESIAIFGAGPIGLMAAQFARMWGAGHILLFDVAPDKLEQARAHGFRHVFDSRAVDPTRIIEDLVPGGVAYALEAAGVAATFLAAVAGVRRGGRCVLMGNPESGVTLPSSLVSQAMRREIAILGTWNSFFVPAEARSEADGRVITDDWQTALQAMASDLYPSRLVSHRIPLSEAPGFLNAMHRREVVTSRVVLDPNP